MDLFLILAGSGLALGAAYGMIAMGFALIYKATGVVNFAQGEMMMLMAYIAYALSISLDLSLLPLMAVVIPLSIAIGLAVERIFIRPMLGESHFSIVMVTIGLAVILRGLVIMIWGTGAEPFNPGLGTGVVMIGPVPFYEVHLYCLAALAILTALFWSFFRFTRLGIAMRATANSERAALLMGISTKRIYTLSWAMSAAIASVVGVMLAIMFERGPDMWLQGLKAFPAVILGGMNSVLGAAVGGLVIGVIENLSEGYIGAGLKEIAGFVVIILVLMIRPYGLFGQKDIERV